MVHAIRIKDGKLYYCNRYLETNRYFCEKDYGSAVYVRIGELSNKTGLTKTALISLQQRVGYKPGADIYPLKMVL